MTGSWKNTIRFILQKLNRYLVKLLELEHQNERPDRKYDLVVPYIDKYDDYNDFDKNYVAQALAEYANQQH